MMSTRLGRCVALAALGAFGTITFAEPSSYVSPFLVPALTPAYMDAQATTKPADKAAKEKDADQAKPAEKAKAPEAAKGEESTGGTTWFGTPSGKGMHKGVSRFWNIREAYSDVSAGQWEFLYYGTWMSNKKSQSDFAMGQTLKYGVTDDFNVELEVVEPLGYSGYGCGEIGLYLHQTFWRESELLPAFGGTASMRIPSGVGSSGFDGRLTAELTKTVFDKFRVHMNGYVEMGGGGRGDWEYRREDIRGFRWGLGPGFDYQLFENTLFVLNYLHQGNLYYGERNQNLLELGFVQKLGKTGPFTHTIKVAGDIGLDGDDSTPTGGMKFLWAIDF